MIFIKLIFGAMGGVWGGGAPPPRYVCYMSFSGQINA